MTSEPPLRQAHPCGATRIYICFDMMLVNLCTVGSAARQRASGLEDIALAAARYRGLIHMMKAQQ
jgi:hypothetical protein